MSGAHLFFLSKPQNWTKQNEMFLRTAKGKPPTDFEQNYELDSVQLNTLEQTMTAIRKNAVRLACAGIGNNILALYQGVPFYAQRREQSELVGIARPSIGGIHVGDIDFVAGFDVSPEKVGEALHDAIFRGTNNYPRLAIDLPPSKVIVKKGLAYEDYLSAPEQHIRRIADVLVESGAEVLLYSLPTGLQWAADAYAEAALLAKAAFVNCTPEVVGRNPDTLMRYTAAGVPLVGDDLASHLGTSIVHRTLLALLNDRGITLDSSYQLNLGGNADFKNLREAGASKQQSKLNALAQEGVDITRVEVIPSAGFVSSLQDNKVAYLNIEGRGWAGTPVALDMKLKVQDSSNAAGVIIDLIRIGAASKRRQVGGFPTAAARLLKSPPTGHLAYPDEKIEAAFNELQATRSDASIA